MAIALLLWAILTLLSVARFPLAILPSRKPARLVIYQASTATSPSAFSMPRKSHSPCVYCLSINIIFPDMSTYTFRHNSVSEASLATAPLMFIPAIPHGLLVPTSSYRTALQATLPLHPRVLARQCLLVLAPRPSSVWVLLLLVFSPSSSKKTSSDGDKYCISSGMAPKYF